MKPLRTLLLSATALTLTALPAAAEAFDSPWGDDIAVMEDEEMADARGGIAIAPGLDINFGALITTFIDDVPTLTTQLTWSETGALVRQTLGNLGQPIQDLSPAALAALGIDSLGGLGGVVIDDENGLTTVVHNVTDGALQNIVINSANDRNLRQEIAVTLEIPGFELMQAGFITDRLGLTFLDDMSAAPQ